MEQHSIYTVEQSIQQLRSLLNALPSDGIRIVENTLRSLSDQASDAHIVRQKFSSALLNSSLQREIGDQVTEKMNVLIDFSGAQIGGSVTVGDVAGRDIIKFITVNLFPTDSKVRNAKYFFSSTPHIETDWVERTAQLANYQKLLERQHVVVITGMPGVGKSTLATMLCRNMASHAQVLWKTIDRSFDVSEFEAALRWHVGVLHDEIDPDNQVLEPDSLFDKLAATNHVICLDSVEQFTWQTDHEAASKGRFDTLLARLANIARSNGFRLVLTAREVPPFLMGFGEMLTGMSEDEVRSYLSNRECFLEPEMFRQLYTATEGNPKLLDLAVYELTRIRDDLNRKVWINQLSAAPNVQKYLTDSVDQSLAPEHRRLMHVVALGEDMAMSALAVGRILQLDTSATQDLNALVNKHLLSYWIGKPGNYMMHSILWQYYTQLLKTDPNGAYSSYHERAGEHYSGQEEEASFFRALFHFSRARSFDKFLAIAFRILLTDNQVLPPGPLLRLLEEWPKDIIPRPAIIRLLDGEACLSMGDLRQASRILEQLSKQHDLLTPEDLLCRVRSFEALARVEVQREHYKLAKEKVSRGRELMNATQLPDLYLERARLWLDRREAVIIGHLGQRREALKQHADLITELRNKQEPEEEDRLELGKQLLNYAGEIQELGSNEASEQASQNDYKQAAIEAFEEARTIFESIGYVRGVATVLLNWGNLHSSFSEYPASDQYYRQSQDLISDPKYDEDPFFIYLRAAITNAQAVNAYDQARYAAAVDQMNQARQMYDALESNMPQALQGQVDSRYRLLDIASDWFHEDPSEANQQRLHDAIDDGEQALSIAAIPNHPRPGLRFCLLRALADAYLCFDNLESAQEHLDEAWQLLMDGIAEDPTDLSLFFAARARFWHKRGQLLSARHDIDDALAYARRTGFRYLTQRIEQQSKSLFG